MIEPLDSLAVIGLAAGAGALGATFIALRRSPPPELAPKPNPSPQQPPPAEAEEQKPTEHETEAEARPAKSQRQAGA